MGEDEQLPQEACEVVPPDLPVEDPDGDDVETPGDLPRPQVAPSALRAATETIELVVDDEPDPAGAGAAADGELADEEPQPETAADGEGAEASGAEDAATDEDEQAWRALPLTTRLEALLFAATAPLTLRRLQALAGDVEAGEVREALASLVSHYETSSRAFGLEEIGGGFQLRTRPELSGLLARLGRKRTAEKLSPAAVETLAIVAYRQPVLRVDIEKIRGVASGEVLRTLVEKGLVRVAGRADLPGAPLLYGTTAAFLELFGLRDLRDLPSDRELLRAP